MFEVVAQDGVKKSMSVIRQDYEGFIVLLSVKGRKEKTVYAYADMEDVPELSELQNKLYESGINSYKIKF